MRKNVLKDKGLLASNISSIYIFLIGFTFLISVGLAEFVSPSTEEAFKQVNTDKCQSLAGVYQFYGEPVNEEIINAEGIPTLSGLAFGHTIKGLRGHPDSARITPGSSEGMFRVEIMGKDLTAFDPLVFEKQALCKNGKYTFSYALAGSGEGTQVAENTVIQVVKREGGSLITHYYSEVEVTDFFIFTHKKVFDLWYRFADVTLDQ